MGEHPEKKLKEQPPAIEALVTKDRELIDELHDKVIDDILRDPIPAEPNIGELVSLFEGTNFADLSSLKERYGEIWGNLSETLKAYLRQKGGKRLRPLFILNSYRTFSRGQNPDQKIMGAGVGVELLHETALLLDDVMDNSTLRRGAPSLWADIGARFGVPPDDAKKIATTLGPLCFSWARHLVVDEVEEDIRPNVAEIFWKAVDDMKRGQTFDIESAHSPEWPELEKAIEWSYLKTCPYSVELPLIFALYMAKVSEEKRNNIIAGIKMFSRGFGLAFQLHDDLLILRTDSEIGKDNMADAINGSKIPLAILARQMGSQEQKDVLESVWGHSNQLTPENTEKLKTIFRDTGALRLIVQRISQEVQNAKLGLQKIEAAGFDISALTYLLDNGLVWMDDLNSRFGLDDENLSIPTPQTRP